MLYSREKLGLYELRSIKYCVFISRQMKGTDHVDIHAAGNKTAPFTLPSHLVSLIPQFHL